MNGPLKGIRIVDLTSIIAGPLATMMLADQGAEVIKVENPNGGDFTRQMAFRRSGFSATFLNNNRNKRSIVLDLKKPDGLAALMRILKGADAFVQNFRPGVADRMGLGEAAVREVAPDLVYVSICGFGSEGPFAQKPVFDPLVQAVSGLTTVQAGSDQARPRLVRTFLPDKLTAVKAAQATTAALFSRERSGKGQHVRISMLDTVLAFLWSSDMGGHTFVGQEAEREEGQSFVDLIYQTASGYISVSVMRDVDWAGLARAVGRPDWITDERFKTAALRETNRDARLGLIQEALLTRTASDWLKRLERENVPCAPVLTRKEIVGHAQVAANASIVDVDHPIAGQLRQARQAAQFSSTPETPFAPAPSLGEHTRGVLASAGFSDEEIDDLQAMKITTPRSEMS